MAQKYTVATSSTAVSGGFLRASHHAELHLSDGTYVFLYYDGTNLQLAYTSNRSSVTAVATVTGFMGSNTVPYLLALCRDSSDNLYVIGQDATSTGYVRAQAFKKGSGYTWTAQTALTNYIAGTAATLGCTYAVWCNTGGGTNSAGHIFVLSEYNSTYRPYSLDAGALLAGTGTLVISAPAATVGSSFGGANTDISQDGFGTTNGILAFAINTTQLQLQSWSVSNTGAVTIANIIAPATGTMASGTRIRILRYAANTWAVISPNSSTGHWAVGRYTSTSEISSQVDIGTPTNMPLNGGALAWDAFVDPAASERIWILAINASTGVMWRTGITLTSGVAVDSAATQDDTLSPYNNGSQDNDIRAVHQPISTKVDWQINTETASTPTYALVGDLSDFTTAQLAPTLNSPANASYQDLSGTPTFTWTDNPSSGSGSQNAYAFRRKVSGAGSYSYWNASTSAWQSTIVWNPSVTQSVTFPAGAWTNGSIYNWSVAIQESTDSLQGPFASDFTVTAQNPPTVSVTAPTGTIANFTPTVTWTDTLASGAAQTSYRVVVYSAAQYTAQGFTPGSGPSAADSGTVNTADTSWPIPSGDLSNNTSYRAYVQVTETGGQTSTWSYSAFTLSVDTPAPPVVTATTGTDPTTGLPLFNLSVQGTDNLLSVDDASFEGSIGTWTATNASLAQDATHSIDGSYSLLLTVTAAGNADGVTAKYTAVGGVVHTAMVSILAQTTARQVTGQLNWYDSNGTLISSTTGSAVTETVGSFVLVSVSGTAPTNAASASLQVNVLSGAASEKHNIDKAGIRPGTTSTTWYRGGLVGSTTAAVQRSDGLYVRNASTTTQLSIPAGNQLATMVDPEVVPTVAYTYTATVSTVVSSSVTLVSPTSAASGSVTLDTTAWWEFDPTDLSTAVAAQPTEFNPQVTEQSTAHLVLGQATPNVVASAMGATDGTATFETFDTPTYMGLTNLLKSQKTVFVSNPFGNPYGVLYVRFGPQTGGMSGGAGNKVKDARLHPSTSAAPHHELSISWVAQSRPAV